MYVAVTPPGSTDSGEREGPAELALAPLEAQVAVAARFPGAPRRPLSGEGGGGRLHGEIVGTQPWQLREHDVGDRRLEDIDGGNPARRGAVFGVAVGAGQPGVER